MNMMMMMMMMMCCVGSGVCGELITATGGGSYRVFVCVCVCACDLDTSTVGWPRADLCCGATDKKKKHVVRRVL